MLSHNRKTGIKKTGALSKNFTVVNIPKPVRNKEERHGTWVTRESDGSPSVTRNFIATPQMPSHEAAVAHRKPLSAGRHSDIPKHTPGLKTRLRGNVLDPWTSYRPFGGQPRTFA